jgi:hypothetical protein
MTEERIRELVCRLETSKTVEEEAAWAELKPLGEAVVPHLAEGYAKMKKATGRVSCVYHSMKYARVSEAAFQLGLAALTDRATLVRYRACGLLAYSLRADALPSLQAQLAHPDEETAADVRAAIDAIQHRNHHYFRDRDHSGRTFWTVNPGDSPA